MISKRNKQYSTKTTLTKHIYQKHQNYLPTEPRQAQTCPNCYEKQMNLTELLKHLEIIKQVNFKIRNALIQENTLETWENILKHNKKERDTKKRKTKTINEEKT